MIFHLKQLRAPTIWMPSSFSGEESKNTRFLGAVLYALKYDVEAWAAAFELYKYAKLRKSDLRLTGIERDLARSWQWIAVHECVMQIYHLRERMSIIRGEKLRNCQTLSAHVDVEILRQSMKLLEGHFPQIDKLRDAVAHHSSVDSKPEIHATDGFFGTFRMTDNDRLEVSYRGKTRHLDITEETLQTLVNIVTKFFSAFEPAEKALERLVGNTSQ